MNIQNIILKSFETFIREPLSFLKTRVINVVNLNSNFNNEEKVQVDILRNSIQVNVINSESAYNLISTVLYKRKLKEEKETGKEIGNQECKISY